MSCKDCEAATSNPIEDPSFIRVETGNVMLVGCDEHVREAVERIRDGSDRDE